MGIREAEEAVLEHDGSGVFLLRDEAVDGLVSEVAGVPCLVADVTGEYKETSTNDADRQRWSLQVS